MRSKYTYKYSDLAKKLGISERTSPGIKGNWRIVSIIDDPTTRTVEVCYEDNDRVNDGPDGVEAYERDPQWRPGGIAPLDFAKAFTWDLPKFAFHYESAEERAARLERELGAAKRLHDVEKDRADALTEKLDEIEGLLRG